MRGIKCYQQQENGRIISARISKLIQLLFATLITIIIGIEIVYGFSEFSTIHVTEAAIIKTAGGLLTVLVILEALVDVWVYEKLSQENRTNLNKGKF